VAHAYSVSKIIGIDNSPSRVEFAKKYMSPLTGKPIFDAVFLNTELPTKSANHSGNGETPHVGTDTEVGDATAENEDDHETLGDIKWEHAKQRVQKWVKELGLEDDEGVDRVVEASGAEDCMLLGIAIAKQGATCELITGSLMSECADVPVLQVGLNHVQTSVFPNIAVTNKELDVKGEHSFSLSGRKY
jgi:D-xylulose reductase